MSWVDVLRSCACPCRTQHIFDSTGDGLIRYSFKEPCTQGFLIKSLRCLKQLRQTFVHKCSFVVVLVQIRIIFDEWRLSTYLQLSLCPSLVLETFFLDLNVVYLVVDIFSALIMSSSFSRLHTHPSPRNVPTAFLPFPCLVHP